MDLNGKVVVISGGSSGIGRATALMLAEKDADVTIIGRDPDKGAEVVESLKKLSGGKGQFLAADFSLVSDTRRVVSDLTSRLQKLDAFIMSAGIMEREASTTVEGLNKTFVTNFLHKIVLAEGIRPLLAKTKGRLVFVSADIPDALALDWKNFEGDRIYYGMTALAWLQAATLIIAQKLAQEWAPDGIDVTAIHPGQVDTGFYRSFDRWPWKLVKPIMSISFVPIEKPAALLNSLAFSPDAKGYSGFIFPSPRKGLKKNRKLKRTPQTLDRVFKTAREILVKF